MARSRNNSKSYNAGRDIMRITNAYRALPPLHSNVLNILGSMADSRRFSPVRRSFRPPYQLNGSIARQRTVIRPNLTSFQRFVDPKRVVECVRRKRRREVMFASGYGGKKLHYKKARQSPYSRVRC